MSSDRRFIAFIAGSFLASFGGWINFLAILDIATWRFNATPFDLVLLSAASLLPSVVLTNTVSRICSRYASTAVIVVALTVTLGTTQALLSVGHFTTFLLIVAIKSAALGFIDPAEMRYVTTGVDSTHRGHAFRLLSLTQNVAKIGAPAAGALVGLWLGADHTMRISTVLIALAIVLMSASASTRVEPSQTARPQPTPPIQLSGAIVPLLCCVGIYFGVSAAVNNAFPLMLKHQGFDRSTLGIVVSCAALGGVIGSLLPLRERGVSAGIGVLIVPACASAVVFIAIGGIFRLPVHPAAILLALAFFSTGLVGARFRIGCRMYIAEHFADRVASASARLQSSGQFVQFIAPFAGAVLITHLSPSQVFLILGSAGALGLVCVARVFGAQRDATRSSAGASR